MSKEKKKMKKGVKITLIVCASLVGALVVGSAGYIGYIFASYNRIGNCELTVNHSNQTIDKVKTDTTYSTATYNIGFGAYSQDYTFFLDTGYDDDGNETCGHYSKGKSKDDVEFNVNGAIKTIADLNVDFAFFQEVDTNSTRSYHINQDELITKAFSSYDNDHAINFHAPYLPYPFYDMHGKVNAGITTLSKYTIQEAQRKQYTITTSASKIFDLDRCFSYSTVNVENGHKLYLVNSHMSAYDKGGTIREKQMEELNSFLSECKSNGDYVIVGGDYNHDLITFNPEYNYNETDNRAFNMTKKTPDWVSFFFNEEGKSPLVDGYNVVASDNTPTCRNNDIEWDKEKTFTCVVDGFIISDNIEVVSHKNIATGLGNKQITQFAYSDHEPAFMEFKLI